jgi:hypothetical protein
MTSHGNLFNVSQHVVQVTLGLDRDRVIAALIHGTGSMNVMRHVPALRMCKRQTVHEARHFIGVRPQNEVPVIGHHAVGEHARRDLRQRLGEHIFERLEVLGIVENAHTSNGSIDDVKNKAVRAGQMPMRHESGNDPSNPDAF